MSKRNFRKEKLLAFAEKIFLVMLGFGVFLYFTKNPPSQQDDGRYRGKILPKKYEITRRIADFSGGTVVFDSGIDEFVEEKIDTAESSVYGTSYTLSDGTITRALNRAAARGISVSLAAHRIRDRRSYDFSLKELESDKGIFHEKYLLIDDSKVILSSRNFNNFPSKNAVIMFENAPELYTILKKDFESLIKNRKSDICAEGCKFSYGTLYSSPGKACVAVKKEIKKAEKNMTLAMYTITPGTPMMTGMRDILKEGIEIYGIADDWRGSMGKIVNKRSISYLRSLGADIVFDRMKVGDRTMLFHHKFAVIDGKTLIFGSMNWTKSGCYRNREYTVIIEDYELSGIFDNYLYEFRAIVDSQ